MAKEWTDEEVAEEIRKAIQIVREDRIDSLIRRRLSAPSDGDTNPKDNPPPSSGNPSNDNSGSPVLKRKSLWWGETDNLSA